MELTDLVVLMAGAWLVVSVLAIAVLVAVYALENRTRTRRVQRSGPVGEVKALRRTRAG